ncbi:MAG: tetratricopeptide repeat protein [Rhodocyclaceae bacterium]
MAVYDLEEQEQLSALKAWWGKYGNIISTGATVVAIGVIAWTAWSRYQGSQSENASVLYAEAFRAAQANDVPKLQQLANQLTKDYPGHLQASLATLLSARADVDKNDGKAARVKLEWITANSKDPLIKDVARLRLAAVLLDDKLLDEALTQANAGTTTEYAGRFAEMRGDVLIEQGKTDDAKAAYKQALEKYSNGGEYASLKNVVQTKLEALGGN